MNQIFSGSTSRLILPFIAIVIGFATVIIGLDCTWRMEKRLRSFMRILTLAAVTFLVRKILLILGFDTSPSWYIMTQVIDVVTIVFLFFAMAEMYRITRFLDGERK